MSVPAAARLAPEEIARGSGSSFLVSFGFLEASRRRALTAIFAYCRLVDDAADDADSRRDGAARLDFWRREVDAAATGRPTTPVGGELARAISGYGVDPRHLHAIADGVAMDLHGASFADLAALEAYCDLVASAVGLACLPLFAAHGPLAEQYAVDLGRALQLTNIARDVAGDAALGRIYLPRQWLYEEGVDVAWLRGGGPRPVYDAGGPVDRLIRRLVATAGDRFAAARAAIGRYPEPRRLLVPEVMGAIYAEVLRRVARRGGRSVADRRRIRVPRWRKLWLAWQTKRRLG